jgi:hypothetical protein
MKTIGMSIANLGLPEMFPKEQQTKYFQIRNLAKLVEKDERLMTLALSDKGTYNNSIAKIL